MTNAQAFTLAVLTAIGTTGPFVALVALDPLPLPAANVTTVHEHVLAAQCPDFVTWPHNNPAIAPDCFEI
jgi:hypothetical protein